MVLVQFAPFAALVHPSFWHALSSLKIDVLQLRDEPVPLLAYYSTGRSITDRSTGEQVKLGCNLSAEGEALAKEPSIPANTNAARGVLKNFNTVEDFRNADKQALFNVVAEEIWNSITTSDDPTAELTRFLVLTFADLKKYRFYYWFGFPALVSKPGWEIEENGAGSWTLAEAALGRDSIGAIAKVLEGRKKDLSPNASARSFFLVRTSDSSSPILGNVGDFSAFFDSVPEDERIVGFIDPSPHLENPGWPLRNLLALLSVRYGLRSIRVLCWKDEPSLDLGLPGAKSKSAIGLLRLPDSAEPQSAGCVMFQNAAVPIAAQAADTSKPSAVGWERNAQGKLAPKMADLGPLMDPTRLADQAVDLNLKLMRWRIMPEINLEKIQQTKCLLLGAGTLGCYVARTLMGWGVRHITFVDSSKVSFSNPVRQPLFEFEDCLGGGKPKAACAAERLRKVYPGVKATGHQMNIPMPGHPVPDVSVAQVEKDVKQLEELVDQHDVVYLLMDSRESRWLPTLLGAAKGKFVINAALGFDTYLVMRHGAPPDGTTDEEQQSKPPGERRLGCYFCNDIVAPSDSLTDRTLDQMCTVTRPGLAAIAGASAVELMVSVLQHANGVSAPASGAPSKSDTAPPPSGSVLGVIPHQLRGFLSQFNNMSIVGQAYDRCTACSRTVIDAYYSRGFEMMLDAFNEQKYLEKLTGLDKMYEETEALEAALDWDEGEEEEDGEGELL